MTYIVKNCPARDDLYDLTGDFDEHDNPIMSIDTPDYCVKYKKTCDKVDDCVIKQNIDFCAKRASIGGIDETAEKIISSWQIEEVNENAE